MKIFATVVYTVSVLGLFYGCHKNSIKPKHGDKNMSVKPSASDQLIIDCLNTYYGIEVATLTVLLLGADINAQVYKAKACNGASYFVKMKRGYNHDIGIEVLGLLHSAGIERIIPPVKTVHGQPIQRIDDSTLIVYPFVAGQDGFSRALTDKQWLTLGRTLRQVHEIDVPLSIKNRIRQEAYSGKWRQIVRSLCTAMKAEPTDDESARKLKAFMQANMLTIKRLVDRAEKLAQVLAHKSPKFVLCHSDIHAGNVLMDEKNDIYIIDWDDPVMAPKERDLMFVGGGVANVWNKPEEEALFYEGYGNTQVNKTILAYYRHERIVEDIADYGQSLLLTMAGGQDRQEMYAHFVAMFEPNGVVDRAFKTDADLAGQ